jgi:hypothetical protein
MATTLRDQAHVHTDFVSAGSPYPLDTPSPLRLARVETGQDRERNIFEIGSTIFLEFFNLQSLKYKSQ